MNANDHIKLNGSTALRVQKLIDLKKKQSAEKSKYGRFVSNVKNSFNYLKIRVAGADFLRTQLQTLSDERRVTDRKVSDFVDNLLRSSVSVVEVDSSNSLDSNVNEFKNDDGLTSSDNESDLRHYEEAMDAALNKLKASADDDDDGFGMFGVDGKLNVKLPDDGASIEDVSNESLTDTNDLYDVSDIEAALQEGDTNDNLPNKEETDVKESYDVSDIEQALQEGDTNDNLSNKEATGEKAQYKNTSFREVTDDEVLGEASLHKPFSGKPLSISGIDNSIESDGQMSEHALDVENIQNNLKKAYEQYGKKAVTQVNNILLSEINADHVSNDDALRIVSVVNTFTKITFEDRELMLWNFLLQVSEGRGDGEKVLGYCRDVISNSRSEDDFDSNSLDSQSGSYIDASEDNHDYDDDDEDDYESDNEVSMSSIVSSPELVTSHQYLQDIKVYYKLKISNNDTTLKKKADLLVEWSKVLIKSELNPLSSVILKEISSEHIDGIIFYLIKEFNVSNTEPLNQLLINLLKESSFTFNNNQVQLFTNAGLTIEQLNNNILKLISGCDRVTKRNILADNFNCTNETQKEIVRNILYSDDLSEFIQAKAKGGLSSEKTLEIVDLVIGAVNITPDEKFLFVSGMAAMSKIENGRNEDEDENEENVYENVDLRSVSQVNEEALKDNKFEFEKLSGQGTYINVDIDPVESSSSDSSVGTLDESHDKDEGMRSALLDQIESLSSEKEFPEFAVLKKNKVFLSQHDKGQSVSKLIKLIEGLKLKNDSNQKPTNTEKLQIEVEIVEICFSISENFLNEFVVASKKNHTARYLLIRNLLSFVFTSYGPSRDMVKSEISTTSDERVSIISALLKSNIGSFSRHEIWSIYLNITSTDNALYKEKLLAIFYGGLSDGQTQGLAKRIKTRAQDF